MCTEGAFSDLQFRQEQQQLFYSQVRHSDCVEVAAIIWRSKVTTAC
jgi:hypothetical protein